MGQDREHLQLLVRVAQRYYVEGASQQDISDEINFSRATVSRLLAEARERGVVRIQIENPLERVLDLEAELTKTYGLRTAWVTETNSRAEPMEQVARSAAEVIAELARPNSVIGLSNGTTLAAIVDATPAKTYRDAMVVQMIGALLPHNRLIDSPDLCRKLADTLGCSYREMPVPLVVTTSRLAIAMRRETSIATTLALGSHPDLAVTGIGLCNETGSGRIFDGWMTSAINRQLLDAGAVGHILGIHFDKDGRPVNVDLNHRIIAVPVDRLADIPTVVGVACGTTKAHALHGALCGGYLDVLVTDPPTAHAVLDIGHMKG